MVLAGCEQQSDSVTTLSAQSQNPVMSSNDILRVLWKISRMLLLGGGVSDCLLHHLRPLTQSKLLQHHSIQYPTLSRMARDYLAIQGLATPSKRAFSSGGTTGTAKRNHLMPEAFKGLQLLKSAYRNGHFSADNEAHKHSLSLIGTELADDDVLAGPKWKGKGCAL